MFDIYLRDRIGLIESFIDKIWKDNW